jgi:hypothetical protein
MLSHAESKDSTAGRITTVFKRKNFQGMLCMIMIMMDGSIPQAHPADQTGGENVSPQHIVFVPYDKSTWSVKYRTILTCT